MENNNIVFQKYISNLGGSSEAETVQNIAPKSEKQPTSILIATGVYVISLIVYIAIIITEYRRVRDDEYHKDSSGTQAKPLKFSDPIWIIMGLMFVIFVAVGYLLVHHYKDKK
ncbi:hypothetical protein CPAV1605_68 [seawater metagenome]|uniref:Uncharacterized protein n=1 Tax=seawater metagenome TaxID=1561972 RepID=A0A5E8CH44_9ZZZZ